MPPSRSTRRTRRHGPQSLVALAGRRSDAAKAGLPVLDAHLTGVATDTDQPLLAGLIWYGLAVQLTRLHTARRDLCERIAAGSTDAIRDAAKWWAPDCALPSDPPATMPALSAQAVRWMGEASPLIDATAELADPLAQLATAVTAAERQLETTRDPLDPPDRFGALYVDLLARATRHKQGEYFTPVWLADYVLELSGHFDDTVGREQRRVLDPTCGSGVFLVRALAAHARRSGAGALTDWLAHDLRGTDANPLAVMAARANLQLATARLTREADLDAIPTAVTLADAVPATAGPAHGSGDDDTMVDLVVGNPPWVNWGDLPADYRDAIAPMIEETGIADGPGSSGSSLRQASSRAKVDIAFPILLHAARRLAPASHARLSAVITRSILRSERGARGIRANFAPGASDAPLIAVAAADVGELSPFPSTAARPAVLVLRPHSLAERDELPESDDKWPASRSATQGDAPPVPVQVWQRAPDTPAPTAEDSLGAVRATHECRDEVALPVSRHDPLSPWVVASRELLSVIREQLIADDGEAAWAGRAREGVNTRGANSILWLRVIDRRDGEWLVENDARAGRAKPAVPTHRAWLPVAPDGFVYPLLRGRDVRPFHLVPDPDEPRAMLLPHDRDRPGVPLAPDELAERSPATADFLARFRDLLAARKPFRNFDPGNRANPFHFAGLYNVGRYTFAPWRVVWRYIATQLEAAVIPSPGDSQPAPVADCKLILTPCDSAAEAHYLCGLLNSVPVRAVVARAFVHTQLSAHLLDRLALPAFDADNPDHVAVSARAAQLADVAVPDVDPRDDALNDAVVRVLSLDVDWRHF